MADKEMLQMAREGKAARDAAGTVDERADLVLALYEAGVGVSMAGVPIETLKQWLADPSQVKGQTLPAILASGDNGAPRVRRGGEAASNQFGTFSVHQASDKQIAFVKRLLAERDLGDIKVPTEIDSISKTAASALIDRLQARPVKSAPAGQSQPGGPRRATDKQMAFLRRLIAERDYYSLVPADRAKVDALKANPNAVPTAKGASDLIDVLTKTSLAREVSSDGHTFDRKPAGSDADALELGMYRKADGTLYRVYPGRESGRVLAKRLILGADGEKATFEYAGLASRFVTASERMSLEEAKAFGHQFGICCVCGALLTDPTSVDAGIGPVCGSRV